MQSTVYAAFPELNSAEVDALLHKNRAADALADLMSRTTGATAVTCCPPELLQQALELLPTTDSPEPIPFFEATLAVAHEDLTCLLGQLRDHELLSHPHDTLRSILTVTVSQMQNVLLRAQIQLASEHRLPDDQITCRTAEYTRLSAFLASKHGLRLFQERFPVAVHIARNIVRRRTDFILQLLDHTASDLPFLHELGVGNDVKVANISLGEGDSHHGKSVSILTFSNKSRVVYKPRSLANDQAFSLFQKHLQDIAGNTKFLSCKVIDSGDHGWAEYVTDAQETRFDDPEALGNFAATIQLLGISDVHFENVRFRDGIPILTDTETLFSSVLESSRNPLGPAARALSQLVTTSGFFPSPLIVPHKRNPVFVDVGVLGQRRPTGSGERSLTLRDPFTSDMRIEPSGVSESPEESPPERFVAKDFIDAVCRSFRLTLTAALSDTPALLAFIRRTFADVTVRSVAADTIRYSKALELATNAACLSDPELLLAALSRVGVFRDDVPAPLIASELRQLAQWDTPAFVVAATGTDLLSGDEVVLPDAMTASPLDSITNALERIDENFIKLSEWLIQVSFAPYYEEDTEGTAFRFSNSVAPGTATPTRRSWDALNLGFVGGENEFTPTWLGARLSDTAHQYWYPHELSIDAYAGSSGVALASAHVDGSTTRADDFFRQLVNKLQQADLLDPRFTRGALAGTESALWAADCYAQLVNDAALAGQARQLLRTLAAAPSNGYDIVAGDAGMVLLMTNLVANPLNDSEQSLAALRIVSRRLADWVLSDRKPMSLTGYAHGTAGVGAALALATPLVRSSEVDSAARAVLISLLDERDPRTGLWPIGTDHKFKGRGWCSGSPGLLLALAQIHSTGRFDDHHLEPTISLLVDATKRDCFGGNISLCHGDVGNLWILRHVASLTQDDHLAEDVTRASRRYLREVLPRELTKSTRNSISHSLMGGTGGAALFEASMDETRPAVRSPLWLA